MKPFLVTFRVDGRVLYRLRRGASMEAVRDAGLAAGVDVLRLIAL